MTVNHEVPGSSPGVSATTGGACSGSDVRVLIWNQQDIVKQPTSHLKIVCGESYENAFILYYFIFELNIIMDAGITYGKYFYPFWFNHYYDIYFSILGEDWEDYDITKDEDRSKITAILSDNLVQYVSEIYDDLGFAEDEDFEDMDAFWKGWDDFLDYMSEQK